MTIQQAIEKAIEGGWKHPFRGLPEYKSPLNEWLVQKKNWKSYRGIFLDPLFWQSLWKAMGWTDNLWVGKMTRMLPDGKLENHNWELTYWQYEWHRFIDHLAEGKDAESFFKNL